MSKNIYVAILIMSVMLLLASCTGMSKTGQGSNSGANGPGSGTGGPAGGSASGGSASQQVAAEVKKGNEIFIKSGCSNCHKIGDEGGSIGPDLSKIGAKTSSEEMMKLIKDPKSINPNAQMPPQTLSDTDLKALVTYLSMLK